MTPFALVRPENPSSAVAAVAAEPRARFIAGGTNLVDLMKEGVETPTTLVDVTRLPGLDRLEEQADGGLRLGALVRNADAARHAVVRERFPLVAAALVSGATRQLRNAATVGGNLLQRTRCYYFTDPAMPCNKRAPGQGCAAREGLHRIHAILGASGACVATHPSDMAVAMAALGAVVEALGPAGPRRIALADFHRLPGEDPSRDNVLAHGELVTAVELPADAAGFAGRSHYLKVRERSSYAFATVSVAAALELEADGATVREARLALGGVAHKPWRRPEAEALLAGLSLRDEDGVAAFADALLEGAAPLPGNAFKVPLARRAIGSALKRAAAGTPEPSLYS